MQTIQFLVLATTIAALIAGLNVSQVAHATDTCVVGPNNAAPVTNPTSNKQSGPAGPATVGNPHCFDPEQQPNGATTPNGTPPGGATGLGTCATGQTTCNNPQSTNGKVVTGNPHEEPMLSTDAVPGSGCAGTSLACHTNNNNDVTGNPHYPSR